MEAEGAQKIMEHKVEVGDILEAEVAQGVGKQGVAEAHIAVVKAV